MTTHAHSRNTTARTSAAPPQEGDDAIEKVLSPSTRPAEPEASLIRLTPREACPVFAIGAQIGRLVAEHSFHDTAEAPARSDEARGHEKACQGIDISLSLLRNALSYQQATSLEGALAQVVVLSQNLFDLKERPDLDRDAFIDLVDTAHRNLHAVAKVLSASTGLSPRVLGSDYYMGLWSDRLGIAWTVPQASYFIDGPKPTVDVAPATAPLVEQQLVELNRLGTDWWRVYEESGDLQHEAESNAGAPGAAARYHSAGLAETHAIRITRSNLIRAMELPAATVREFGLQARLIAVELDEWWDGHNQPDGETACRQLLSRLIALAGLTPIRRKDLDLEEARGWIRDPLAHAYSRDLSGVDERFNRDLPAEG